MKKNIVLQVTSSDLASLIYQNSVLDKSDAVNVADDIIQHFQSVAAIPSKPPYKNITLFQTNSDIKCRVSFNDAEGQSFTVIKKDYPEAQKYMQMLTEITDN